MPHVGETLSNYYSDGTGSGSDEGELVVNLVDGYAGVADTMETLI